MFNPCVWLDRVLLDAAQKFCDKFQRLTGLTKFTFQKWAVILSMLFFAVVAVYDFDLVLVAMAIINTTYAVFIVYKIEEEESKFLENRNLTISPFHDSSERIITLFFATPFLFVFSIIGSPRSYLCMCSVVCIVAWVYFSACIPRPPGKSKAREWSEKAMMWLNDKLKPAPVPEGT